MHGPNEANQSDEQSTKVNPPFWVRHYDGIVGVASLGRTSKLHQATLDLAQLGEAERVLDVGCGTGTFLLLAERNHQDLGLLVGLDGEAGMIAQAASKARETSSRVGFYVAGIESIPYPDESFDVVTSSLMLHHLSPDQQRRGLSEVCRVLAPGGRLVVVDMNAARRSVIAKMPGHRTSEVEDAVQALLPDELRAAGLAVEHTGQHKYKALSYAIGVKP